MTDITKILEQEFVREGSVISKAYLLDTRDEIKRLQSNNEQLLLDNLELRNEIERLQSVIREAGGACDARLQKERERFQAEIERLNTLIEELQLVQATIPEIVIEERDEARAKVWQLHQELNALQTHFDIVTKAGAGKDAEIERLRGENECLAAAMSSDGADACGALVVANAEIERLQLDLDLRTKEAHRHVLAIQHKDGLLLNQEEEIERLRELLRAAGVPEWVINARLSHE